MAIATAERLTARIAESDTTARACQATRSSAVGNTSSVEANTQSSTNAGTNAPPETISSNLPGSSGFHDDSAHPLTTPAATMKRSVWLM